MVEHDPATGPSAVLVVLLFSPLANNHSLPKQQARRHPADQTTTTKYLSSAFSVFSSFSIFISSFSFLASDEYGLVESKLAANDSSRTSCELQLFSLQHHDQQRRPRSTRPEQGLQHLQLLQLAQQIHRPVRLFEYNQDSASEFSLASDASRLSPFSRQTLSPALTTTYPSNRNHDRSTRRGYEKLQARVWGDFSRLFFTKPEKFTSARWSRRFCIFSISRFIFSGHARAS